MTNRNANAPSRIDKLLDIIEVFILILGFIAFAITTSFILLVLIGVVHTP